MTQGAEQSQPAGSVDAASADLEADSRRRRTTPSEGRLLIVDDERSMLRSLSRVLQGHGFEVVTEGDGEAALQRFRTERFDVVLSDISMPGWDGIQLLRSLHQVNEDVPVVLMTGEPALGTAMQALEFGAFRYLTKPLDMAALTDVMGQALKLRRVAQAKRHAAELVAASPVRKRQRLEGSFSNVLDSLWIAFQPIVHSNSGEVFGYEALLRSNERSLVHPSDVIDAAEKLGQLDHLGRTIRGHAAQALPTAPDSALLFVNLHTTDLLDPHLLSAKAPLSQFADRVVLEITERSSLQEIDDVRGRVRQLRDMGYRIAVDDLGAGYAGLSSFALLEPEIVKLDMTLVRNVHQSRTRQKLIRSMTTLCKDMGMMIVGEGIERPEERDTLVELGCDLLQGFILAKPGREFPQVSW